MIIDVLKDLTSIHHGHMPEIEITSPTTASFHREIDSGYGLNRLDNLKNGIAAFVATVASEVLAARAHIMQCIHMSTGDIADLNIVSDASTVWGRIICPKDLHTIPSTKRGLDG